MATEEIHLQHIRQNEPGDPKNQIGSFVFVDGHTDGAQKMVEQPITAGLLQGKQQPCVQY